MRASRYYIPTLKEAPADAEVVSHKLLTRAGMIRKLTSGIYTYLPMGLAAIAKISNIVREEMDRAGALELLMPAVQPGDLWRESGRWEQYGKELLRFKDRHARDYCLGPTHEEAITDLVRGEVRSYRQLPLNMYQIQNKFRDEIRPRFGLMRGREFLMKDGYSFDRNEEGADASYWNMHDAYVRIFKRLGLKFRVVEADSGAIGGSCSHEFMVLTETGEDTIVVCASCSYAANIERAAVALPGTKDRPASQGAVCAVATPGMHSVEDVAAFLKVSAAQVLKTLIFVVDGRPVAVLARGDREVNSIKVKNFLDAATCDLAGPELVKSVTGAPVGFAGPVGLDSSVPLLADHELIAGNNWISGANKAETHLINVDLAACQGIRYADLRFITPCDPCPQCGGAIALCRGIEVGHVFKLGLKYSEPMGCTFLDEDGKEKVMVMGCYGIGVSRVMAAAVEQNNDADGIRFPPPIAPFEAIIICLDPDKPEFIQAAERAYDHLRSQGLGTLLDDRQDRPGAKFKDADLLGAPMQLVVGAKGVARGVIEAKDRRSGEKAELPIAGFADAFAEWRKRVYAGWGIEGAVHVCRDTAL